MKRFGTILLVGVAVLLLVPAFMRSSPSSQLGPGVVVMTPHNEQIRFELGSRFSQWHQREFGTDAHVAWSTPGGPAKSASCCKANGRRRRGPAFHLGVTLIWCSAAVRMSTVSWPSPPRPMILSPPFLFPTVSRRKSCRLGSPPTPLPMGVCTTRLFLDRHRVVKLWADLE